MPTGPQKLRVLRSVNVLSPGYIRELVDLMLHAFSLHELDTFSHYMLDVQLNEITTTALAPLPTVREHLVRWCHDHDDKLVQLLNAILEERPSRRDIKLLIEKFAAEGLIEIES
jgi:hypothetical protein